MIKEVVILDINSKQKQSKEGKNYTSVGIKIDSTQGPKWVNGFGSEETRTWQKGSKVKINIEQNGQYWNFKPVPVTNQQLLDLLVEIRGLLGKSAPMPQAAADFPEVGLPTEEEIPAPTDEDCPF